MKDREKIEELLQNFKRIKANIEVELNKKYREYSLDSVSFPKLSTGGDGRYSDTEQHITEKYSISDELENKIKIRNIVQAAYDSLTREQKRIVTLLYFEDEGVKATARKVGWSEDTIRRRREKILQKLKDAGILEAWDVWMSIVV